MEMNTFLVMNDDCKVVQNFKRVYSIFDLKYFLKMTGASASVEKASSMKIDVHEKFIDELVIL